MKVRMHQFELPLEHEFTIAHGSMTVQRSLVVELENDGGSGFGESTENPDYGFSLDSMAGSIESCKQVIESYCFGSPAELWMLLQSLSPRCLDEFKRRNRKSTPTIKHFKHFKHCNDE